MKTGIIVAMDKELDRLSGLKRENIKVSLSGIGKVNAAMATCELISSFSPDLVVSIGVSGAMKPDIRLGEIVIGDRVAYHDVWCGEGNRFGQIDGLPGYFECDPVAVAKLMKTFPSSRHGLLVCGDQFYISRQEDNRILSLYPEALAADMESGAIAHVCHVRKVPFCAIRIISDTHEDNETQSTSYNNFWIRHNEAFDAVKQFLLRLEDSPSGSSATEV